MADDSQIRETIAKPKRLVNQPQEKIWAKLNEIASIFRERLPGSLGKEDPSLIPTAAARACNPDWRDQRGFLPTIKAMHRYCQSTVTCRKPASLHQAAFSSLLVK